jgi:hypothetical protein
MKKRLFGAVFLLLGLLAVGVPVAQADTTDSTVYGSGNYGNCDYGSCTITLSGGGSTTLNVVPTPTGKCTVQSDTASVLTDSTSGYSLTMTTSTTNSAMTSGSNSIAASSGTASSPVTLAMNTWGYRVDGLSGFGTGPTSAQSSGSIPSVSFAGVPASNQAGTQVASSGGPANPAVTTTVWYGLCANASQSSGNYSVTVTYTAVTN